MKVTGVRLVRADAADIRRGLLAYGSIELEGCFVIDSIKLFNNSPRRVNGMFVQMPNIPTLRRCDVCGRKTPVKEIECLYCKAIAAPSEANYFRDVCHPTTPECRDMIESAVFAEWQRINAHPDHHRDEIPEEVFGGGLVDA